MSAATGSNQADKINAALDSFYSLHVDPNPRSLASLRSIQESIAELASTEVAGVREASGGHSTGFTNEKGESVSVSASARGNHTIDVSLYREDEKVFEHSVSSLEARALSETMASVGHFKNSFAVVAQVVDALDARRFRFIAEALLDPGGPNALAMACDKAPSTAAELVAVVDAAMLAAAPAAPKDPQ